MIKNFARLSLIFSIIYLSKSCTNDIENHKQPSKRSIEEPKEEYISDSTLLALLKEETKLILESKNNIQQKSIGMTVVKDNPKKVYVHYMPWFQNLDYNGYWGQHWTMNTKNPDIIIDSISGKREIASHYYPLIGPYASEDPDLQEYHFLLMKLSGVDGVIFDWYGSHDLYDYELIKNSTETFMNKLNDLGLKFSIMYEDRVAFQSASQGLFTSTSTAALNDFQYIKDSYFNKANFLKVNNKNLFFIFGPNYITQTSDWDLVFSAFSEQETPYFLTLWASQNQVGQNASGEFLWIAPDHLLAHDYYYNTYLNSNQITVGSVYPGFNSFYTQGGWAHSNFWSIDHNSGNTFIETLNYTHHEAADFIQIATWNDFGEGTMIEPTQEYGYANLEVLQDYTGVNYDINDLKVAEELYKARKEYSSNKDVQDYLDRCYVYIKESDLNRTKRILIAVDRFF